MTDFAETVRKLQAQPVKAAHLHGAISDMRKHAGIAGKALKAVKTMFGDETGAHGGQQILKHVAQTVGATAVTGGGALIFGRFQQRFGANPKETDAKDQEMGRLHARNNFKVQQTVLLNPQYGAVYKSILADDTIGRADKDLVSSSYETMKKFAPNLAADENAARSFVLEHVIHGSRPGYATLKNLAEAEQAVANSGGAF